MLSAVGDLLTARQTEVRLVVVGGAAMNLLEYVRRATDDVDVIALGRSRRSRGPVSLIRPEPLPPELLEAVRRVAKDFGLPETWLNAGPASQWDTGLPPGIERRLHWRQFGGLHVGLADRYDLIFLKLYAAADDTGPRSVHYQDLLSLAPTEAELSSAADWVGAEDPSPGFAGSLQKVLEHVRRDQA